MPTVSDNHQTTTTHTYAQIRRYTPLKEHQRGSIPKRARLKSFHQRRLTFDSRPQCASSASSSLFYSSSLSAESNYKKEKNKFTKTPNERRKKRRWWWWQPYIAENSQNDCPVLSPSSFRAAVPSERPRLSPSSPFFVVLRIFVTRSRSRNCVRQVERGRRRPPIKRKWEGNETEKKK